jgi:predicted transcriptional regulator
MRDPFPVLDENASVDEIFSCLAEPSSAVLIGNGSGNFRIITKWDLIHSVRGSART